MEYRKTILNRKFYDRDTSRVAKDLLGKVLVKESGGIITSGIIVETEAYYGSDDPASHAFGGSTSRSSIMFGKAGIAYIYLCYGVHWLLNIVTEKKTTPGAVLIRGLKPVDGIGDMQKRRKTAGTGSELTNGPGKLTVAMGIDSSGNGKDVTDPGSGIYIADSDLGSKDLTIKNTKRIQVQLRSGIH